jgi:cell division septum initiation protein DivIVA
VPRPRTQSDVYAAAQDDYARLQVENNQVKQERDRFRNELHKSELRNVDFVARVKELEHDIDNLRRSTTAEIDHLKELIVEMRTLLSVGANQFLTALQLANKYSPTVDVNSQALAAVEAALPDEPTS